MEPRAPSPARRWFADGLAGVSVALILIPQSMAYAELAGLPAHRGLYAGALPPLAAAFFASSPYLQTGPVALTSLLTFGALSTMATPGTDEYVVLAALLAIVVGAVRVAIGLLRAGAVSYLMSQPVLRGFTAAAALLILSSQLPSALGVVPEGNGVLEKVFWALSRPAEWEPESLVLSAVTLILMLGGKRLHALFPGVLVAVLVGVVFSTATGYDGVVLGQVPSAFFPPLSLDLPWSSLPTLAVSGAIIALVGFAEAASVSQTYAEQTRRPWDPDREFLSQGAANLAAGFAGSFPVGGSFSRSAVNKMAGAQTRASGGITGIAVLLFLPFAWLLAPLPKAILGAIVVGAVLQLLKPAPMIELWKQSKLQAAVGYSTFGLTIALAPQIEYAVLAGVVMALSIHVWRETKVEVEVSSTPGALELKPRGVLWFGSAPLVRQELTRALSSHPAARTVRVDLSGVGRIDLTGANVLADLARTAEDSGVHLSFECVPPHARRILQRICPAVPCVGGEPATQSVSDVPHVEEADADPTRLTPSEEE